MAVTMREVAAMAGVSPVVVSRVLHNKASTVRVSEATAERVRQAASILGYRCNVVARNFRAQETKTIGILHNIGQAWPNLDQGSRYFAALMQGILTGAFKHGYAIMLCPKLFSEDGGRAVGDGRFDGIVWYRATEAELCRTEIEQASTPVVMIHSSGQGADSPYPTVICDNAQGIRIAVDHLVKLGHKRIAYLVLKHYLNSEAIARRDAFASVMQEYGLYRNGQDIIEIDYDRKVIENYLSQEMRHTAIIGMNDEIASDVLALCYRYGISVPEQLSVVGFDSTAFCNELVPALTSIHQPLAQMGEQAIDMLVESIKNNSTEPNHVVFPCSLDRRDSTSIPLRR